LIYQKLAKVEEEVKFTRRLIYEAIEERASLTGKAEKKVSKRR
jgi:hypothetical protein